MQWTLAYSIIESADDADQEYIHLIFRVWLAAFSAPKTYLITSRV